MVGHFSNARNTLDRLEDVPFGAEIVRRARNGRVTSMDAHVHMSAHIANAPAYGGFQLHIFRIGNILVCNGEPPL